MYSFSVSLEDLVTPNIRKYSKELDEWLEKKAADNEDALEVMAAIGLALLRTTRMTSGNIPEDALDELFHFVTNSLLSVQARAKNCSIQELIKELATSHSQPLVMPESNTIQ